MNILCSPFGVGDGGGGGIPRRRSYIPSPLGSPAAARRLGQRLGDRLCSSPILSRVKKKWKDGEEQASLARVFALLHQTSRSPFFGTQTP